ncbi:MAG TPA: hypothetical protein VMV55_02095, partial [Methanoregula sp.]|nr:hypothetical protein [Methanoregula sp.]
MYAPNGTYIGRNTEIYSELLASLSDTGTYTIIVGSSSTQAATPYSLFIQRVNNPEGYEIAESGTTVTATIGVKAEMDTYRLTAQAGDGIIVRMSGTWDSYAIGSLVEVYGPEGSLLARSPLNWYGTPQGDVRLQAPVSGQYTILAAQNAYVEGGLGELGAYSITFWNNRPQQLFVGRLVQGATTKENWQIYYLDAPSGEDLLVQVSPLPSTSQLEVYGVLNYAPTATSYE